MMPDLEAFKPSKAGRNIRVDPYMQNTCGATTFVITEGAYNLAMTFTAADLYRHPEECAKRLNDRLDAYIASKRKTK